MRNVGSAYAGLATATTIFLGASLMTAPQATATDITVTGPIATFNDPSGTAGQQNAIKNQLLALINGAAPGSQIHGSVYLFTDNDIRAALVSAAEGPKQVAVKLILDGDTVTDPDPQLGGGTEYFALADALGTYDPSSTDDGSWVLACPKVRGCVGNRRLNANDDGAINHNKFFLFSQVGEERNIVFQTSANLTRSQLERYYNNAVTVPDAGSGLYAEYLRYWEDLRAHGSQGEGTEHYYITKQSGRYKTYFFPRRESDGSMYATDPRTDTIVSLLGNVQCGQGPTSIRVGMYAFTRPQVADKLVDLATAGCTVRLVHNGESGSLGREVGSVISGKLSSIHKCDGSIDGRVIGIHSKYMLIEGTYLSSPDRKIVFTGSHNYTFPNLRSHDETLLKIDDSELYEAYRKNFDDTLMKSPHCRAA
ncbi:phospholipase D-like domain-containing protein [Streptomyces peucetius]|uniref:phospholipase D n=1 Tax=Streptomyces peucetius TaxID=1950 RepID=A0ABY6IEI1_STRPE|nr:phospholipase D-like domain-containing protein [Streptomyces peucetius]UYQ65124.1 phospholipase D-like domain-containing protein [Streptomyces peucetius]